MVEKITYNEFLARLRDPSLSDVDLRPYVILKQGNGGLDFELAPDPAMVEMTAADQELENAMKFGNGLSRFRRRNLFFDVLQSHPERPIIVSEGDSWFQFPMLIDDTIDHLLPHFNIWSLGAAGATLKEMISGTPSKGGFEFLGELRRQRSRVRAFLFSGAGNDIIGEDPETKEPVLDSLLHDFNGNALDVHGHIDFAALNLRVSELLLGYTRMVGLVRAEPGLQNLPIIVHGYDYVIPYSEAVDDPRNPVYADKDQWLGRAFQSRGIMDPELRQKIIVVLIDRLYDMLFSLRDAPGQQAIHVVDCRGAMPNVSDWNDEIHGTSKGFAEVGRRFLSVLNNAISEHGS